MLIIADENMPFARAWFAPFGTVRTLPGREIDAAAVRAADALLVRSVTEVDAKLLRGSNVRFVGSATSGIEHIDVNYLQARGIACASAPGCNATAVVEYVLSCLVALQGVFEKLLAGGRVGIIGFGHVGARLAYRLQQLGIQCIAHDPLLSRENLTAHDKLLLRDLTEVIAADVVCCHTPLTKGGSYPTWHLFDAQRLRQLRSDAVLINAGRGAVIDNTALLQWLRERNDVRVVLDVWENEPEINRSLLDAVAIATPHIAGYSWDGKIAGTRAVLHAFCAHFDLNLPPCELAPEQFTVRLSQEASPALLLRSAMQSVYDVRRDDLAMREAMRQGASQTIAPIFDRLRKHYPQRREIGACRIENSDAFASTQRSLLQRLGFSI